MFAPTAVCPCFDAPSSSILLCPDPISTRHLRREKEDCGLVFKPCSSGKCSFACVILMGLQSTLSPPNRKRDESDTAVSVCHERPTGAEPNPALHTRDSFMKIARTHAHTHSLYLSHTHTHTRDSFMKIARTHAHTHTLSISLTHSDTHTHSLYLSHTHTHTHTHETAS